MNIKYNPTIYLSIYLSFDCDVVFANRVGTSKGLYVVTEERSVTSRLSLVKVCLSSRAAILDPRIRKGLGRGTGDGVRDEGGDLSSVHAAGELVSGERVRAEGAVERAGSQWVSPKSPDPGRI